MVESKCGFNIGDRVALVVDEPDDNSSLHIGDEGVIWSFHPMFDSSRADVRYFAGVRFDEDFGGHRLGDHGTEQCENGHGWWVKLHEIGLVEQTDISFDADTVDVGFLFN